MFEAIKNELVLLFAFQFLIYSINELCVGFESDVQVEYEASESNWETSDFLLKKSEESCSISWNPVSPHSMKNVTEGYTRKNITNL